MDGTVFPHIATVSYTAVVGQTAAVICDARKPSRRVLPDTKVFLHMVAAHAKYGQ